MAITASQAQGLVLALFGASAGGHLTGLTGASSLTTLAADLSMSAGLILDRDLSSNTAFRDLVLTTNLKLTGTALTEAQAWMDGEFTKGTSRADILAAAVTFLDGLTDTTNAFYATAAAYRTTVTNAVTWSQGAGATVTSVATLMAQQGTSSSAQGQTFTLTTGTDTLIGTAGNDTFTGTATNYSDNDRVIDATANDNDTYTVSVAGNAVVDASGVENVNVTTEASSAVTIDASKLSGVKVLTVTPGNLTVGGSTIAGSKAVTVQKVDATKITSVAVGAGASGDVQIDQTAATASLSKTGATIDAANATGNVTITGAATLSADNAAAATGKKVIVQAVNGASAAELAKAVTVNAAKAVDVEINDNTSKFTGAITVNAAAAKEVQVQSAAGGATINAAIGATSTGNGIVVTGITSNGATITTGSYGSKSASGTISNEGLVYLGGSATSATDDVATVTAAGYVALTTNQGAEQVETVNLSGNGAALELSLTGAATKYNLTGTQDVILKGNVTSFAGKTLTDNTTAGTTEVRITTLDTADLSKVAADRIVVASNVASKTLTVASGATVVLASDETTAFAVAGKTADSTVNLSTADDTNNSGATIDITTGTLTLSSNIATVNLDATVGKLTVSTATVLTNDNSTNVGATLNITGSKAVALCTVTAKAVAAGSASGAITLTANGANTAKSITTGSGADAITLNQAEKFTVDAGNGDNTITVTSVAEATSIATGSGTDTVTISDVDAIVVVTGDGDDTVNVNADSDAIIAMGNGSSDTAVFGGNYDLTSSTAPSNSNFALTGVETVDITAANGTLKVRAAAFAQDNVFKLIGDSATADIFHVKNTSSTAGATIDASGVTFASTQNAALYLEGAAALADTITGSAKVDRIIGTTGADIIDGGAGVDTYVAPAPGANIEGTATGTSTGFVVNLGTSAVTNTSILAAIGKYTASTLTSVAAGTTAHVFDAATAAGQTQSAVQQTISNIENVEGGTGADYIVGSANANKITAGAGNDYVNAGAGDDEVVMGVASADLDTANGGAGTDTLTLTGTAAGTVVIDLSVAADADQLTTINSAAESKVQNNFENVDASAIAAAVNVTGSSADNTIKAAAGGGTITGGDGADTITLASTGTGGDNIAYTATSEAGDTIASFVAANDALKFTETAFGGVAAWTTHALAATAAAATDTYFEVTTDVAATGVDLNAAGTTTAGFVVVGAATGTAGVKVYYTTALGDFKTANSTLIATLTGINTGDISAADFVGV